MSDKPLFDPQVEGMRAAQDVAVQMLEKNEPTAPPSVALFDRYLRDSTVDVDKLERLMQMWERTQARIAEQEFNAAMSKAQAEMLSIAVDSENLQTHSRYASYTKLDSVLRPIYTRHGFGLSFDTADSPLELHVRVLCYVTHGGGHARTYHADMPADGKGAKGGDVMTKTHATGSALSYGQRYLLKLIFNVAVNDGDDDGNAAGRTEEIPAAPQGFDDWAVDMAAVADNGFAAFSDAWRKSKQTYREYAMKYHKASMATLKVKAQKVQVPS